MLRNEVKDRTESEHLRKKQAALQTKSQKRWRAKGVDLEVLINQYNHEEAINPEDDDEDFLTDLYPTSAKAG